MPLNSIANITISLSALSSARPSFGISALFTLVTAPQEAAFGANYGVVVTASTYTSVLEGLGFSSSDDIYVACQDHFSQDETPEYAIVARRATPVAQVVEYTVGGTTDGTYAITLDGASAEFVASSNTAEEIRDGLIAAIALLPLASYYSTATVSTDGLTVTAANAGLGFTTSVESPSSLLTQSTTTPNEGIADDIDDLRSERNDWWAVDVVAHSDTDTLAAARHVETLEKLHMAQSNASDIPTNATDDVLSIMQDESLIRTALVYSTNDDQFVDCAWLGRVLPTDVGSNNWAYQDLRSVTGEAIDAGEEINLLAKNANWLEQFEALGNSTMRQGRTAGGQWIDTIRIRDWLKSELQIAIYDALRANPKIPYTDDGLELLGAIILSVLQTAADQGAVDRESIVVNVPKKSAQTQPNIDGRHVTGLTFQATLTGAVNSVDVDGALVN